MSNPANRVILRRLPDWGLPDAWLVAGCLFQTAWNIRGGRPAMEGIRDYDLFYFDAGDLSVETESAIGQRVATACADLGVTVEVKNQARVHTWYEPHFGAPYPPLRSATEGIDRFLVEGTCIGLQPDGCGLRLYASDGLDAVMSGELRVSRRSPDPERSLLKMHDYQQRWPWLRTHEHPENPETCPFDRTTAVPLLVRAIAIPS